MRVGSDGRVARQRSAKPPTAVRIRFRPLKSLLHSSVEGIYFFYALFYAIPQKPFYYEVILLRLVKNINNKDND